MRRGSMQFLVIAKDGTDDDAIEGGSGSGRRTWRGSRRSSTAGTSSSAARS
jgi:hypothetical protein